MIMARREQDYLFKRHGLNCWRLRLPDENGKYRESSLGTEDRLEAERRAHERIMAHKERVRARRPRYGAPVWCSVYHAGLVPALDKLPTQFSEHLGRKAFATERELHVMDESGATVAVIPNGCMGRSRNARAPKAVCLIFATSSSENGNRCVASSPSTATPAIRLGRAENLACSFPPCTSRRRFASSRAPRRLCRAQFARAKPLTT
jgi:hypothetical protein